MHWHFFHKLVSSHVVRIESQNGTGTGFLFGYNKDRSVAAVATAAHVVVEAHRWRQPLQIIHHESGSTAFLANDQRGIFVDQARDSASILMTSSALKFPADPLPLIDPTQFKKVGVEVAWMGFPSVAYPELCFFKGNVSAFLLKEDCYLIDGVAINGVSGGPVFAQLDVGSAELIGTVSAYLPNRLGNTPGLLRAQDISAFHNDLQTIRSLDEAKEKEAEARKSMPPERRKEPEHEPATPRDLAAGEPTS